MAPHIRCWRCKATSEHEHGWEMLQVTHSNEDDEEYRVRIIGEMDTGAAIAFDDRSLVGLCPACRLNKEE